MKALANENFPRAVVEALRAAGHDVVWVRTEAPGSEDRAVLEWARAEGRLLLTFDKDFGELVFRAGLAAPSGVVLWRVPLTSASEAARTVLVTLHSRDDWAGHFSVVDERRVRMIPLPSRPRQSDDVSA